MVCSRPTRERVKALASRPIESPTTATLSDAAPAGRRPRRRRGGGGRGPPPRSRCRALVASRGTERSSGGGARAAGGLVDQAGAAMTGGDRGIGVRGRSPGRYIHAPTFGGGVIGNTAGSGPVIGGSSPPPRATAPEAAKYPAPSSSGLGHHPLKVETRVRTPLGLPLRIADTTGILAIVPRLSLVLGGRNPTLVPHLIPEVGDSGWLGHLVTSQVLHGSQRLTGLFDHGVDAADQFPVPVLGGVLVAHRRLG